MEYSKQAEIQKQVNFVFKDFDWDNARKIIDTYESNKDSAFYDIEEDLDNKKVKIRIKPHDDRDMVFEVTDDGK